MGSGNDGRTLTQTEGIWLSASRNLECSDMGDITITDQPRVGGACLACLSNRPRRKRQRDMIGSHMPLQPISHYEVLEKLGEGGMGVVWKARDTRLNRLVAIKTLPAGKLADEGRQRRFIQEAQAASALNDPNIIT